MAVDSLTGIHAALARISDEDRTLREPLVLARAGVFDGDPSEQKPRDRIERVLPRELTGGGTRQRVARHTDGECTPVWAASVASSRLAMSSPARNRRRSTGRTGAVSLCP